MKPMSLAPAPVLGALLCLALTGCYFSSKPPRRFYGAPQVSFAASPVYTPPSEVRPLVGTPTRLVLMPRWTSLVTNPVGGLYDEAVNADAPLMATFFHRDVALPIWEASARRLRSYGLRIYKDYRDVGNPALLEPAVRKLRPLLLRASVASLAHDQRRRRVDRPGNEGAWAKVHFDLLDEHGRRLWQQVIVAYCKKRFDSPEDLLAALGNAVTDALLREGSLLRVLAAVSRPATPAASHQRAARPRHPSPVRHASSAQRPLTVNPRGL